MASPMSNLPSLQAAADHVPELFKSTFFVSNVHCSSCVTYITEVLSDIQGVRSIDVSILTHEVRVIHSLGTQPSDLAAALIQAAFEVHHVTTADDRGTVVSDLETAAGLPRDTILFAPHQSSSLSAPTSNFRHMANCDACRKEELGQIVPPASDTASLRPADKQDGVNFEEQESYFDTASLARPRSLATAEVSRQTTKELRVAREPEQWIVRISIGGMSCASCVNTITNEIRQLDYTTEVAVNLLTNSATMSVTGPRSNVDKVVEQIEDMGFEASLDEARPVNQRSSRQNPTIYIAEIAIGGMTCGSCAGAVTRGLEELPFVTEVSVNLLSHSGKVEFRGCDQVDQIIEKIEDLGYDASINSLLPKDIDDQNDAVESRIVAILVDGMFCHHCPDKVLQSIKALDIETDSAFSVNNPILTVTYVPRPPHFTIRDILRQIEATHDAFKATIHHPPSIEDRSRAMQLHERRRLLARLIFVFFVAVPTFILGIVFMSIVSPENAIRVYLEQSMWVGSVSRMEWALFIMTTPVMFYGTDIFHVRAMKEIYSLWRPGSRVPILRRFYRFGSMNLLISAGTTVAYVSSLAVLIIDAVVGMTSSTHSSTYFDTVVFLTLFILAGRFIEAYSKARTGDAVASLGKLKPSEALLVNLGTTGAKDNSIDSDEMQRVNIDLLEVGDLVRIPHGASPPADGVVIGESAGRFDESSLTGESKPVGKTAGDPVYTGSVNVGQPVKIKITAIGGSSMLDQIISVVREGQSRRAPLERVADLLTAHFVPIITLIAIMTFVIWLALGLSGALPVDYLDVAHGGWAFWSLEFAISVFVVACPCGLALAAPTALFVGGGLAARHGILVKGGGEAFQEASRLDAIVFDKTGTLTEGGSLAVSDHELLIKDTDESRIAWSLARKLEESSNHPIARAIADFCNGRSAVSVVGSEIEEMSGQGMRGSFSVSIGDDQSKKAVQYEAAIGNQRLVQGLTPDEFDDTYFTQLLSKYQEAGKSTTILALRQVSPEAGMQTSFVPAIVFAISDSLRPGADKVVAELWKRKVDVFMCTGDNQTTAYAVADAVGIPRSNVTANVLPAGKADFVRHVQNTSQAPRSGSEAESGTRSIVAFVGDGVNDSPALAAADVSIAMASGSDVAMNSASFVLLNSELNTILQLVVLSRRVFNRVRLNFGWAVVYNLCLVPIAAGVLYPIVSGHRMQMVDGEMVMMDSHWRLNPVWAALAMALSSISVVCSSLALGIEKNTIKSIFGRGK